MKRKMALLLLFTAMLSGCGMAGFSGDGGETQAESSFSSAGASSCAPQAEAEPSIAVSSQAGEDGTVLLTYTDAPSTAGDIAATVGVELLDGKIQEMLSFEVTSCVHNNYVLSDTEPKISADGKSLAVTCFYWGQNPNTSVQDRYSAIVNIEVEQ